MNPSEPSQSSHSSYLIVSSFGEIEEHLSALLGVLEALGDCVSPRISLVSLSGCRHLDGLVQRGSSSGER
jgi:hypothetical protein